MHTQRLKMGRDVVDYAPLHGGALSPREMSYLSAAVSRQRVWTLDRVSEFWQLRATTCGFCGGRPAHPSARTGDSDAAFVVFWLFGSEGGFQPGEMEELTPG